MREFFWMLLGWRCHEFGRNVLWLRGLELEGARDVSPATFEMLARTDVKITIVWDQWEG